jgi:hypothetical protein
MIRLNRSHCSLHGAAVGAGQKHLGRTQSNETAAVLGSIGQISSVERSLTIVTSRLNYPANILAHLRATTGLGAKGARRLGFQ